MRNLTYVRCVYVRDLLSLSVEEAATHIGGVETREWINWESNKEVVPESIIKRIDEIAYKHQNLIKALTEQDDHTPYVIQEYQSFEEYLSDHPGENFIDWKIAQNISLYTNVLEA